MSTNRLLAVLCVVAMTLLMSTSMARAQDSAQPLSSDGPAVSDGTSSSDDAAAQDTSVTSPADATTPVSQVKQVGTPFPLEIDPGGVRIGPVHMTNISTSGFVDVATPQGSSAQQYWGTSVGANLVYSHPVNNGLLTIQANPNVSVSNGTPYLNTLGGLDFTKQLTARWSMSASSQWTFYQNTYLLQTSQYLLAYAAGGLVLQRAYAQQAGSTISEANTLSMNYQVNGRSQLSISPIVNLGFTDINGVSQLVGQLGASASVTHSFTPNRSGFLSASVYRSYSSVPTGIQQDGEPSTQWNNYSVGGGFNQKIGQTWYVAVSASASLQQQAGASSWLPTGSASIMKNFHNGNLSAAYSRREAAQVLLSSGYFDQADVSYVTHFGPKVSASVGAGAFRSINTGSSQRGKRAYASVSYRWVRNLSWSFAYNLSSQNGTGSSLYYGDITNFTVGLNWALGHPNGR
jgi:hypothetical protein